MARLLRLAMEELEFPARMSASVMLPQEIVNWEPPLVEKNLPLAPKSADRLGYLLVGHGTRRQEGQQQFRAVFQQFASEMAPAVAEMAFLELAEPDISTAVERMAVRGIRNLVTVPVLLFEAGHALEDIPREVASAAKQHQLNIVGQSSPFQCSAPILELSALRFRETVCNPQTSNWLARADHAIACEPCPKPCLQSFCSNVALLMIGRGSNSESATDAMRRFTMSRLDLTNVSWAQTAFLHGQTPNIETGFTELAERNEPIKVVQPHLIFEGLLSRDIEDRVRAMQQQRPDELWLMPGVLSDDNHLAKTLAVIAKNTK